MHDIAGNKLHVGDVVTDSRGKLFEIRETPPSVQAQRISYATELKWARGGPRQTGPPTAVRQYTCLRVDPSPELRYADQLKVRYREAYKQHMSRHVRAEISDHKRRVEKAMPKEMPVPEPKSGDFTAATWERLEPDYKAGIWKERVYALSYSGKLVTRYTTCNLQRHLQSFKSAGWKEVKVRSKHASTRSMIDAMDRWATKRGFRRVI